MRIGLAEIRPGRVEGVVRAPGSKSETHRALLLAAQATEPSTLRGALRCDDTDATLAALLAMGARLHADPDGDLLHALPAGLRPPAAALDCGGSATALRLLTATTARLASRVHLTGDASLRRRPHGALLDALARLGARVESQGGMAPVAVAGPIAPGAARLPAAASSQFASALLLSLPFLDGPSTLRLDAPLASAPYLDVTASVAGAFGVAWSREGDGRGASFHVPGGQRPRGADFAIGGDWSAAAFPLVAAAVTGGRVRVEGVRPDSAQGDRAILGHLASFGARVRTGPEGAEVEGGGLRSPGAVDVAATPDLFPALAVLAAAAEGTTEFTGGSSLRGKESDRIRAMAAGLAAMGIRAEERPDGLSVRGGRLAGAAIHAFGDHRVHMAFAVAGLAASGTTLVDGAAAVSKSHPGFHRDLAALGASVLERNGNAVEVAP